jgi:N-methylhydantoinase A
MALQAVLHVGLSFANVGLFEKSQLLSSRRFFLPQEPLKNSLKKFWEEFGTPEMVTVSSRYLERILDAKLGGSVAQIVTSGFETWPILTQPVQPEKLHLHPVRQEPLASQDLIFGISERISSDGKIISPLVPEELDFILAKLKLMNVKRICINLLFANKNPAHETAVVDFFKQHEFEIFASPRNLNETDEMPAWRKNILNACLSGAFTEHLDEIQKSFGEETKEIRLIDALGEQFSDDKNQISSSLFGWTAALKHEFKNQCEDLLYLGIENWSLLSMSEKSNVWQSPWGEIQIPAPANSRLSIQPSLEIVNSMSSGLQISEVELGFEPGPISFGRAQKTMVFDILLEKFNLEIAQKVPQGTKRFQDQMTAVIKNSMDLSGMDVPRLVDLLLEQIIFRIGLELQFKSKGRKILITGYFAESLFPLLKKKFPQFDLEIDHQSGACALRSLASVTGLH